jgi:tRNA (guanine-N1)-methyltransferase
MRFDIVTLFPELFAPFMTLGVTRRAFETRQVDVRLWPLRDFGEGAYRAWCCWPNRWSVRSMPPGPTAPRRL